MNTLNIELIDYIKTKIKLPNNVEHVLKENDRGHFCGGKCRDNIYNDNPYVLDRRIMQTMSAPHIHAMALNKMYIILEPILKKIHFNYKKLQFNVLDIGCGSGYITACMADLIRVGINNSKVIGIDIYKSLVKLTKKNLRKTPHFKEQLTNGNIIIKCGNGWNGWKANKPYHFIHVGAMANSTPMKLVEQLAIGGGMIIPINGTYYFIIKRSKHLFDKITITGVRFVELIDINTIRNKKQLYPKSNDTCIINT